MVSDNMAKEKDTAENKDIKINPNFKYKDDMSMMMAWQNWCWMHYSWSVSQAAMIQAAYHKQLQPGSIPHSFSHIPPTQPVNNQTGQTQPPQPSYGELSYLI